MKHSTIPTVSVGIAALNDSHTILYLLRSILKQKEQSFTLKEIIVICDGSTDNTAEKVIAYAQKHPVIKVVKKTQAKGIIYRVREIFSMVSGDYTVLLSGKVVLSDVNVIEKIILAISKSKHTGIVSPKLQPLLVKGIIPNIISKSLQIRNKIYQSYNAGNIIYTLDQNALAIRSSLAKQIIFPKAIVSLTQYLYFLTASKKMSYEYVNNATVFFQTPITIQEYASDIKQLFFEKQTLSSLFGHDIYQAYHLPFSVIAGQTVLSILKNPLNIASAILFTTLKGFLHIKSSVSSDSVLTVSSTKRKAHSY